MWQAWLNEEIRENRDLAAAEVARLSASFESAIGCGPRSGLGSASRCDLGSARRRTAIWARLGVPLAQPNVRAKAPPTSARHEALSRCAAPRLLPRRARLAWEIFGECAFRPVKQRSEWTDAGASRFEQGEARAPGPTRFVAVPSRL